MADPLDFYYPDAGSEAQPPRRRADWAGLAGGGLIGAGIVLELVNAFLVYPLAQSGALKLDFLLLNALGIGALGASAGLVVAGSWPTVAPAWPDSRSRRRVYGGLLAASLCAMAFVNSLSVLGDWLAGLESVPYMLLTGIGWLPVAAGVGLALARKGGLASIGRPGRPRRADALPLALLAVTVAGVLLTVVLSSWIAYTFTGSTGPHTEEFISPFGGPQVENLFGAPWAEIAGAAGQLAVIVGLAAAAALWRPARFGAVLLTGAVVLVVDQALLATVEVIAPPSLASFGVPAAAHMTLTVTGTPWMWAYCGFTVALIVVYEWLFIRSRPRPPQATAPVTWIEPPAPWTAGESTWNW